MLFEEAQKKRYQTLKEAEDFVKNVSVMFADKKRLRSIRNITKIFIRQLTNILYQTPSKKFRRQYLEAINELIDVKRSIKFFVKLMNHEPEDIVTFKTLV